MVTSTREAVSAGLGLCKELVMEAIMCSVILGNLDTRWCGIWGSRCCGISGKTTACSNFQDHGWGHLATSCSVFIPCSYVTFSIHSIAALLTHLPVACGPSILSRCIYTCVHSAVFEWTWVPEVTLYALSATLTFSLRFNVEAQYRRWLVNAKCNLDPEHHVASQDKPSECNHYPLCPCLCGSILREKCSRVQNNLTACAIGEPTIGYT